MVSTEATFWPTLAGEKVSLTVGAAGVTVRGVGQAVAAVPADDGAFTVAVPVELNDTVPVSERPAESVTVRVKVPGLPFDATFTCAVPAPDDIVTPPLTVHA